MRNLVLAGMFAAGLFCNKADAAVNIYTIDPALSTLTQGGVMGPVLTLIVPMTPQTAGSLTAAYTGTVTADVTGSTIDILSGTATAGIFPGGPLSPAPGGVLGSDVANYGGTFDFSIFGTVDLATRGLVFDIASSGPTALIGGDFAASDVIGSIVAGAVDVAGTGAVGSEVGSESVPLASLGVVAPASPAPVMGTLETIGSLELLTIPVDIEFMISDPGGTGVDVTATLTGSIVATRTVITPEPASLSLLAAGGLLVLRRKR